MQRLYRFELVKDRYRGPANAVMEGRDLSNNSAVTVCEWMPQEAELAASTARLAESMATVEGAELFSTGTAFYIVADDDRKAAAALQDLRSRGLFAGSWPGLIAPVEPPAAVEAGGGAVLNPLNQARPVPQRGWIVILVVLGLALVAGLVLFLVGRSATPPPPQTAISNPPQDPSGNRPVPSSPQPANPQPQPPAAPETPPATSPPESSVPGPGQPLFGGSQDPARVAVLAVLKEWRATMLGGDVDGQTDCYAPVVEIFFRRKNLDREVLRGMKRSGMVAWAHTDVYEISETDYQTLGDDRASATFRKHWESSDANRMKHFSGEEQERLTFARYDGEWKIVREEELTVYWVKKD
jgi:hypothetical protein